MWPIFRCSQNFSCHFEKPPNVVCNAYLYLDGTKVSASVLKVDKNEVLWEYLKITETTGRHFSFSPLNVTGRSFHPLRRFSSIHHGHRWRNKCHSRRFRIQTHAKRWSDWNANLPRHGGWNYGNRSEQKEEGTPGVANPWNTSERQSFAPGWVSFFPFAVAFNDTMQTSFCDETEIESLVKNRTRVQPKYQCIYDTKEMLAKFTFRYRPLGKRDQPDITFFIYFLFIHIHPRRSPKSGYCSPWPNSSTSVSWYSYAYPTTSWCASNPTPSYKAKTLRSWCKIRRSRGTGGAFGWWRRVQSARKGSVGTSKPCWILLPLIIPRFQAELEKLRSQRAVKKESVLDNLPRKKVKKEHRPIFTPGEVIDLT